MPYIYNHHAGWRLIVSVVHQKQTRRLRSRSLPHACRQHCCKSFSYTQTLPTFWTERWSTLGIFILGPFGCLSGEATLPNSVSFQNKHTSSFVYIDTGHIYIYTWRFVYVWNGPMLTRPHLRSCSRLFCSPCMDVTLQKRACQMPRRGHHCHLCLPSAHCW